MGDDSEHFSLRWKNFHSNLQMGLEELLEAKELLDVTFACEGRSLHAHKNILAVCSPYFRSLFKANPCKHPIIIMQDVRLSDLTAILQFIYRGETDIGENDLPTFLKTAEALQVKGLAGNNKIATSDFPTQETTNSTARYSENSPSPTRKRRKTQDHLNFPPAVSSPVPSPQSNFEAVKDEPLDFTDSQVVRQAVNGEHGTAVLAAEAGLPFLDTASSVDPSLTSQVSLRWDGAGPSLLEPITQDQLRNKSEEQKGEGFLCGRCNKFYTSRYNLKAHERNIHSKDARPALCELCQKTFKNEDALRTHTYYKHTGPDALSGQTHKCNVCGKTYKLRHDLASHEKNAHGEFARPFKCEICLKVCKNWHALQTHKSRNHKQDLQRQETQVQQ